MSIQRQSASLFEKAFDIADKTNLKLWRLGLVLGKAINRKKLGEEIDPATISQEINKFHKQDKWEKDNEINYYRNYLYYIIFEEKIIFPISV